MSQLQVARWGDDGPAVVLVHGSLRVGEAAWSAQEPLGERWKIFVPYRRGYGESPSRERVDYYQDAGDVVELLANVDGGGAHLVGVSAGALVSLLAAARRPELVRSLTVIEPPAWNVAAGNPDVDSFVERVKALKKAASPDDPEAFLQGFLDILQVHLSLPSPLPPAFERSARLLMTESPWEVAVPLVELARAPFRKLVVSGETNPAFEAVCDALAEQLPAERAIFPGAGHAPQSIGTLFNKRLEAFLDRANSAAR
jgi:pimeloyl-ACP methyl ester carboxylesterase